MGWWARTVGVICRGWGRPQVGRDVIGSALGGVGRERGRPLARTGGDGIGRGLCRLWAGLVVGGGRRLLVGWPRVGAGEFCFRLHFCFFWIQISSHELIFLPLTTKEKAKEGAKNLVKNIN